MAIDTNHLQFIILQNPVLFYFDGNQKMFTRNNNV